MPISTVDHLMAEFRDFLLSRPEPIVVDFIVRIDWSMAARPIAPKSVPCAAYLQHTAALADHASRPLVEALASANAALRWGQTYSEADFGRHFIANYGWVELFGTRGHFANDRIAAGLLMLGPGIEYPDHHHVAEEIYIPLTGGTDWRKGGGDWIERQSCEVIHHPSNVSHAIRTGTQPLLAVYLWRGGPLAARSTISVQES